MTTGAKMADVVELLVSFASTTAALLLLLAWDERRLSEDARARAWPVASRRVAVVVFGPFCLPVHFARTRRTWLGALVGCAWMLAVLALSTALTLAVAALFDGGAHEP